jgi:hypothetical protein
MSLLQSKNKCLYVEAMSVHIITQQLQNSEVISNKFHMLKITGFLDFVHRPEFYIQENKVIEVSSF